MPRLRYVNKEEHIQVRVVFLAAVVTLSSQYSIVALLFVVLQSCFPCSGALSVEHSLWR